MSSDALVPRSVRTLFVHEGRVMVDSRAPLSSTWITRSTEASFSAEITGQADTTHDEDPRVQDMPCGVLARRPDGSEVLVSVDGVRLELDGVGNVRIPSVGSLPHAGIYMVLDDRPPPDEGTDAAPAE